MELNEVSEIEIKTFEVKSVKDFNALNLHQKLKELQKLEGTDKEDFSKSYAAIGLGDAFQKTINAMHRTKARVALITERRVITIL